MKVCRWIGKHVCFIVCASIAYMLSFHLSCLDFTGIFFYDGILRLLFVTVVIVFAELLWKRRFRMDAKDVYLSVCTFFLVNMLWLSLCIVSLDRSLSVFLLCTMDQYEEGMSGQCIDDTFQKVFVEEYGMLDRRFMEQIKSGNVVYKGGTYRLTERGRRIVWIFRAVGELYNVDKRFINP